MDLNLPIFEIFIKDDEERASIALVTEPAIEADFIYFNANEPVKMLYFEEKMMVKGPALIPNKLMYREKYNGYVYFSEDTILKFVEMLMNKKENKFNLLHTNNYTDLTIIESYFATEQNEFGVPKGSWIISAKVKDQEVWQKIKSGELKGFSVEGLFGAELVSFAEDFKKTKSNMNELKEKLFAAINNILFDEKPTENPVETTETFEKVENQEEVKEEAVEVTETTDEVVQEEVKEETKTDALTLEIVKSLLDEMKSSLSNELTEKINLTVSGVKDELKVVKEQVDVFSKQPITESVKEEVANPKINKANVAAKFFVK